MFRPVLISLATVASLAAGSMLAHGRDTGSRVVAPGLGQTTFAQVGSADRVSDAIAAAVIGSISREFDTSDVTIKLDAVNVAPASVQDREVAGAGRLRLAGDPQWIPFRFVAMYDTESTEVTHPHLQLGDDRPAGGTDAALGRSLGAKVAEALKTEFAGQTVAWTLQESSIASHGSRFVHVVGRGVTDFGPEGTVQTRVQGLYDRQDARWLRVNYELGGDDAWNGGDTVASL